MALIPPPLLSLFLILVMIANNVRSQGDVTSFQYDTFEPNTEGLTYERDAFVPSGSTHLSLIGIDSASEIPRSFGVGRVLYSSPVNFWESGRAASFETTYTFMTRTYNNAPGHGMTFFIVPVNSTIPVGGEGGSLGIFHAVVPGAPIFYVEFDIVSHPEDPNFHHIGININSRTSANVTRFEGSLDQVTTVRVNYDAPTRRIDVVARYGSVSRSVSYVYDLKTLLPQQVQVGLSAATGERMVASFDIYSWYFTSSMIADRSNTETYIREVVM